MSTKIVIKTTDRVNVKSVIGVPCEQSLTTK